MKPRGPRTLLVMAGGTGGHIFPALAVAEHLRAQGWTVVWMGTRGGMEERLVPPRGFDVEWIRFSGVRGGGPLRWVMLPLFLLLACWQAAGAIFRRRPDTVLGMGGFASFPGGLMASALNRPLVLHEQNSVPGLANRVLAGVADRILTGFPDAFSAVPSAGPAKIAATVFRPSARPVWTGNPVRPEIAAVAAPEARFADRGGPLRVLVVGGSLGAQALNEALPAALAALPEGERPRVVHQAGTRHAEKVAADYATRGLAAEVLPFLDDMARRYAECDLVVCRAGALTIAELAAAGVASVLVPFPHAVDDHQTANARFLSDRGAAVLLPQPELTPQKLRDVLSGFTRGKLLEMARRARELAKPDATEMVAHACMEAAA